jgi:glycosyltransferase involved in cell wall biosynthesis
MPMVATWIGRASPIVVTMSSPPSGSTAPESGRDLPDYVDDLRSRGIHRVHTLAWRDLDDPDAGGSEVHADEFMTRWAAAGLEITHRTSSAVGQPSTSTRHGYSVERRGSRYTVFPRAIVAEVTRSMGPFDALVEIWNGVPWFSPVWCRRPNITVLHHVHGPMWDQILPGPLATLGRGLESRLAPPFYRRTEVVTPSDATREELLELGFRPQRVTAVPNGTDPGFRPGGVRTAEPSIVAVARLAPVKRLSLLVDAAVAARERVPHLTLTIVGDGPDRSELEQQVAAAGAADWVEFAGRVDHDALVGLYQRSWIVASASLAEGWGLSLTEAAGCGTPAVATDIRGHRSSVVDGVTGLLAAPAELGDAMVRVLTDDVLRARLGHAARERATTLTWDASALGIMRVLHRVCMR